MASPFEWKLRNVQARCNLSLLLSELGLMLIVSGVLAVLLALVHRTLGAQFPLEWVIPAVAGAGIISATVRWTVRRVRKMQAALLLDERGHLKERFSTVMALEGSDDPFALAATEEAHKFTERLDPNKHFSVRPTPRWYASVATWGLAGIIIAFVPNMDLLGYTRRRQGEQQRTEHLEQAKMEVEKLSRQIKSVVEQLDDPELRNKLDELTAPLDIKEPTTLKRQAIRKLTNLSDELQKMQDSQKFESARTLQKMLRELRGFSKDPLQEFTRMLGKGDFRKAADFLRQLQDKLGSEKMSDEQRKALSEQLDELAKQLDQISRKNDQLKDALRKSGLNEQLAKLDPDQLRKALEKQGLNKEKLEKLLKSAKACRLANSSCRGLGHAMGALGAGLGSGELGMEQLDAMIQDMDLLDAIRQDMEATEAALNTVTSCIGCLGKGSGRGRGTKGLFAQGPWKGMGPGTGKHGSGYGPRDVLDGENAKMKKTHAPTPLSKGKIIASWYMKGMQIKGESRRELKTIVQGAKDVAAEAIGENRIPRKYQESVKQYFGTLEEKTAEP